MTFDTSHEVTKNKTDEELLTLVARNWTLRTDNYVKQLNAKDAAN